MIDKQFEEQNCIYVDRYRKPILAFFANSGSLQLTAMVFGVYISNTDIE
jgi:hypothetical protein